MDPRAAVHAQCGLVPVKQVVLPPAWVDAALGAMSATFNAGPSLVETRSVPNPGGPDLEALVLTAPAERHGSWTWLERDSTGAWVERPLTVADSNAVFCNTRPTLRDGMFKLANGLGGG
jgi:hypothetical protein